MTDKPDVMTLADFDYVMDILQQSYDMRPAIKFWLCGELYRRFFEINDMTAYEARLKEIENA